MNWLKKSPMTRVSECGRYEMRGQYNDGSFAWRGRFVQTDELIASSQDRGFVSHRCEQHALAIEAQA